MGARNRDGIGLSYRPARLHRLAKSIPWNLFLGSLKVKFEHRSLIMVVSIDYKPHRVGKVLSVSPVVGIGTPPPL